MSPNIKKKLVYYGKNDDFLSLQVNIALKQRSEAVIVLDQVLELKTSSEQKRHLSSGGFALNEIQEQLTCKKKLDSILKRMGSIA